MCLRIGSAGPRVRGTDARGASRHRAERARDVDPPAEDVTSAFPKGQGGLPSRRRSGVARRDFRAHVRLSRVVARRSESNLRQPRRLAARAGLAQGVDRDRHLEGTPRPRRGRPHAEPADGHRRALRARVRRRVRHGVHGRHGPRAQGPRPMTACPIPRPHP